MKYQVTPFGAALRALLLADPAIGVQVGERVHPHPLPAGSELPAITYQRIGGGPVQEHSGLVDLGVAEVQLDVWASTDSGAEMLGVVVQYDVVETAPAFTQGAIRFDSVAVLRDRGVSVDKADVTEDAPVWRYSFDVSIAFTRLEAA